MKTASIAERVTSRLGDEVKTKDADFLLELCDLATTRVCLRIKERELPELMTPIVADIVIKLWRRANYEGISSESADKISTSFVEDIMSEYDDEFKAYENTRDSWTGKTKVKFY